MSAFSRAQAVDPFPFKVNLSSLEPTPQRGPKNRPLPAGRTLDHPARSRTAHPQGPAGATTSLPLEGFLHRSESGEIDESSASLPDTGRRKPARKQTVTPAGPQERLPREVTEWTAVDTRSQMDTIIRKAVAVWPRLFFNNANCQKTIMDGIQPAGMRTPNANSCLERCVCVRARPT
jgi:hypothetical protein